MSCTERGGKGPLLRYENMDFMQTGNVYRIGKTFLYIHIKFSYNICKNSALSSDKHVCIGKDHVLVSTIISFGPVRKTGRERESTGFCACWEAMATTSEN